MTASPQQDVHDAGTALRLARAVVLLIGAVVLLVLVEAAGVRFFWVPSLLGATYLLAAAASRSRGPLWAPGWVLAAVGLTEALWFRDGRPAESFQLAQLVLLAAGTGALLAALMRFAGVHVTTTSVALSILLTAAFNLAEQQGLRGVAGNTRLYAGLLAAYAVVELGLVLRRSTGVHRTQGVPTERR